MNPKKETQFGELQLKLGIKSSLPNIKAALALLLSIWESGIHSDEFVYAKEVENGIVPVDAVVNSLSDYFGCDSSSLFTLIANNPLYKSQMEALQVAFELGWRIAKFSFVDESFPFSQERTGGKRYAKKISYTKNIDVVSLFLKQDENNKKILYSWLCQTTVDESIAAKEDNLKQLLTALSEECVFRIRTEEESYNFRNYGIYDTILDGGEVSITDAKEQVGPLRILNSIINDGLNYYFIKQPNGTVKLREGITRDEMEQYSARVQNYLSLSDVKMSFSENTEENNTPKRMSPEWFSKMAEQYSSMDIESDTLYKDFRAKFGPEALKAVEGNDLLRKIFINETRDKENLCYVLEFDRQFTQFGGIGGGSAYKYGLYYNADKQSWVTGSARNPKNLSLEDAIALGTIIRNEILAGVKVIETATELSELKDYAELNTKLYEVMPTTINKKWVIKYLHMLFPQLFPPFYNDEWQNKVLTAIDEEPDVNSFVRMGQIALFVKKCGISTLAFSKVIYNLDSLGEIDEEEEPAVVNELCTFESEIKNGKNIVVYGTPGCGKSFYVQNKLLESLCVVNDEEHRIRTTFYQDYTNTDFVGQIIPKVKEDKSVTYEFNPGPFALALKMAIEHPNEPVALIIEELNRGNAASIFGDIFQLLDRTDDGKSQYKISNVNLQDYLNKVFKDRNVHFEYIVIPSNLHIIATMNTSDQNVFTLDTAFKRRWKFEKLPNIFADDHEYAEYYVPGMKGITWKKLVKSINDYIVSRADELSSEDKQLGVYFIGKETLSETQEEGVTDAVKKKEFAYKLLEYLWDDVAKYNHSDWFGPDVRTLDKLIEDYMEKGQEVFVDGILK